MVPNQRKQPRQRSVFKALRYGPDKENQGPIKALPPRPHSSNKKAPLIDVTQGTVEAQGATHTDHLFLLTMEESVTMCDAMTFYRERDKKE